MIVASRYAKSLIDLAVETKQLEEVRADMKLIKSVCEGNREFVILLESPVVKTDKKMAIFKEIFGDKISVTTLTFLNLIATKRREGYIDNIAYAFDEQYKIYKNITSAEVTSAAPLDADNRAQILAIVSKTATGQIELIEKVDKSLIGGFILTVDGKRVDTTVKRKLNDLRKNFSGNVYVPDLN
jgi:F-type H+-transporting ATPase subunit delta